jgi:hypothetical protein
VGLVNPADLTTWNAGIIRARHAYNADRLVADGYCETGCGRVKDGETHRKCRQCQEARR